MNKNKLINLKKELEDRIILLSHGILPPFIEGKPLKLLSSIGVGAGPQGKTFFILNRDNRATGKMISVPIFPIDHYLAKYALKTILGDKPGTIEVENGIILKSINIPSFLNKKLSNGNMLLKEGPAMMHCYGTCSTVMGYGCKHFDDFEECKYCEIDPVAVKIYNLPKILSIEKLSESLKLAVKFDKIRSITITSGTFDEPDNVAKKYIELLTDLRKEISISIHIQIEPINDLILYKKLSVLADSIGIFLEIFNEEKREEICPGKAKLSLEKYIKNWETAVKYFKKGNVMTTCLLGFNENYDEILEKVEDFAKIGVKTAIMFVRCKSKKLNNFIPSYLNKNVNELVEFHINIAKILKEYNISFNNNDSGCLGCQGCTAMMEAADYVNSLK